MSNKITINDVLCYEVYGISKSTYNAYGSEGVENSSELDLGIQRVKGKYINEIREHAGKLENSYKNLKLKYDQFNKSIESVQNVSLSWVAFLQRAKVKEEFAKSLKEYKVAIQSFSDLSKDLVKKIDDQYWDVAGLTGLLPDYLRKTLHKDEVDNVCRTYLDHFDNLENHTGEELHHKLNGQALGCLLPFKLIFQDAILLKSNFSNNWLEIDENPAINDEYARDYKKHDNYPAINNPNHVTPGWSKTELNDEGNITEKN